MVYGAELLAANWTNFDRGAASTAVRPNPPPPPAFAPALSCAAQCSSQCSGCLCFTLGEFCFCRWQGIEANVVALQRAYSNLPVTERCCGC